jgi:hypothetical protein
MFCDMYLPVHGKAFIVIPDPAHKKDNVRFALSSARLVLASLSCFALRLKPRKTGTRGVSVPEVPPLLPLHLPEMLSGVISVDCPPPYYGFHCFNRSH